MCVCECVCEMGRYMNQYIGYLVSQLMLDIFIGISNQHFITIYDVNSSCWHMTVVFGNNNSKSTYGEVYVRP